jgi:TrmH family RNA methyltransferase
MSTILGAHSPKLELVRALKTKAGRNEQNRYAIEGPTLLAEATAAGAIVESLFVTERTETTLEPGLRRALAERTFVIPDRAMARLSDLETAPGILAILPTMHADLARLLEDGAPVALLAGVSDPGNAGTLLRSAEIFGIDRAIFTSDGVELHNPKVVRATMGAVFRMRITRAAGDEVVAEAERAGYTIVAAARGGVALPSFAFERRSLLAVGGERHGVARSLPRWDGTVTIPHLGAGESLNAAVAGGIIFYAFSQQISRTISSS